MKKLTTQWGEKISPEKQIHPYPRPQMVRDGWTSLNGLFEYAITDSFDNVPKTWQGTILVPFSPETQLSGVGHILMPYEYLHYKKSFELSLEENKRMLLNFEAVDWHSKIYLNGKFAGENIGGYIPFSIDITDYAKNGENELIVSVYDPTESQTIQRGKQSTHPEAIWYTPTSGIWQSVWLEQVPQNYIKSLEIKPNVSDKCVVLEAECDLCCDVEVTVWFKGEEKARAKGKTNSEIKIELENIMLWSPDEPNLYDAKVRLLSGEESDSVDTYFGIREILIKEDSKGIKRTYLNGQPIFLHGVLDQGYWPESGMTPPCDDAIVYDIKMMKELGFNMLRKHVKAETRRWYYYADKMGMLVFQDMMSGGSGLINDIEIPLIILDNSLKDDNTEKAYKKAGREDSAVRMFFERELMDMLLHLHNSPSIIAWVPFNEGWGQYDSADIAAAVKRKDPNRLVDAASGWVDMKAGDFNSVHRYIVKLPKPKKDDRAYFISEYGGYNLPIAEHLMRDDDKFGYRFYGNSADVTTAYEKLIYNQLIPLIKCGLTAAVYTQLSDVEIESNGFLTYDRKVLKMDKEKVAAANRAVYAEFERQTK